MAIIHVGLPEIEDQQFPGHSESDLIKRATNASAVGALVERTSQLHMILKLPRVQARQRNPLDADFP